MINFEKIKNYTRRQPPQTVAEAKLNALHTVLAEEGAPLPENSVGQGKPMAAIKPQETLTDDVPLADAKVVQIQADEALAREIFALLGQNYDALIQLNPQEDAQKGETKLSPYAQAVKANPAVLQQVFAAQRPVLAALKVALNFQPYAEFMQQYGTTPQDIKNALKAEAYADLQTEKQAVAETKPLPAATPFSLATRKSSGKAARGDVPLNKIFNQ